MNLDALTPGERDVVQWIAHGKSIDEVAAILKLHRETVRALLLRVRRKLG